MLLGRTGGQELIGRPAGGQESFDAWHRLRRTTDDAIGRYTSLDAVGVGNARSVRWTLQKLVGDYARHNGHADLLRERIDGRTGEQVLSEAR